MGIPALETLILLVAQRGDGREHPSHRSRFSAKIIIGNTTSLQHLRLPSPATPAPLPAWTTVHQAPRAWGLSGGASGPGPPAPLTIRSWKLSLFFLISQRMLLFLLLDFFLSFFLFFYGDYFTSRDFAFLQQQTWSPPGSVFTSAFRKVYEAVARTIPGGRRWGQKELEKLLVGLCLLFLERWALSESRTPGDLSGKRTPHEVWVPSSPRSCPGCLLLPPLLSLPVCRAAVFAAPA